MRYTGNGPKLILERQEIYEAGWAVAIEAKRAHSVANDDTGVYDAFARAEAKQQYEYLSDIIGMLIGPQTPVSESLVPVAPLISRSGMEFVN